MRRRITERATPAGHDEFYKIPLRGMLAKHGYLARPTIPAAHGGLNGVLRALPKLARSFRAGRRSCWSGSWGRAADSCTSGADLPHWEEDRPSATR